MKLLFSHHITHTHGRNRKPYVRASLNALKAHFQVNEGTTIFINVPWRFSHVLQVFTKKIDSFLLFKIIIVIKKSNNVPYLPYV